MTGPLSKPRRVTNDDPVPEGAARVALFESRYDSGALGGTATVYRQTLEFGGQKVAEGYIIRYTGGSGQEFEQTTLNGKLALREAANKFGWGL